VKFKGIESVPIIDALKKLPEADGKHLQGVASSCQWQLHLAALELLSPDHDKAYFFEQFASLMRISYKRDWLPMFDWVDNISADGREKQKTFCFIA
jgi:hypothetical protein